VVLEKTLPASRIAGLSVLDLQRREDASADRQRALQVALDMLLASNSRLYSRVVTELHRVVFLESGPEFWPRSRACVLDGILEQSEITTACQLVHEATHARLWRIGFRYQEEIRYRIERICVRAELELLANIPGSDLYRDETLQKLRKPWWTAEEIQARRKQDLKALIL
jgi:hypothetical protein